MPQQFSPWEVMLAQQAVQPPTQDRRPPGVPASVPDSFLPGHPRLLRPGVPPPKGDILDLMLQRDVGPGGAARAPAVGPELQPGEDPFHGESFNFYKNGGEHQPDRAPTPGMYDGRDPWANVGDRRPDVGPPRSAMMPAPAAPRAAVGGGAYTYDLKDRPAAEGLPTSLPGQTRTAMDPAPKIIPAAPGPAGSQPAGVRPTNPLEQAGGPVSPFSANPASVAPPVQAASGMAPLLNPMAFGQAQKDALTALLPEASDKNYLAPAAFPGLSKDEGRKTTVAGEQKLTQGSKQTAAISDPAYTTAYNRMIDGTPGLKMQRDDVKHLRAGIEGLLAEDKARGVGAKANLAPLLALSDTWFGGNLMKGYTKPVDQKKLASELAKTLSGAEGKLTDDEINFMKAQLGDQYTNQLLLGLTGQRIATGGVAGKSGINPISELQYLRGLNNDKRDQDNHEQGEVAKIVDKRSHDFGSSYTSLGNIDRILNESRAKGTTPPGFFDLKIPGVGRLKGNKPDILKFNENEKDLAREVKTLQAALIHFDSGAQATNQEVQRKASQLGVALNQGPEQFAKAVSELRDTLARAAHDQEEALSPGARKKYDASKVLKSGDFAKFRFGKPAVPERPAPLPADQIPYAPGVEPPLRGHVAGPDVEPTPASLKSDPARRKALIEEAKRRAAGQ